MNKQELIGSLTAQTAGSKIFLKWNWINNTVPLFVENIKVMYMVDGKKHLDTMKTLESSIKTDYVMTNIVVESKYKICLRVIMKEKWPGIREPRLICTDNSNTWELSAFFGSTAGALLALILIIMLILFSKRAKKRQKAMNTDPNDKPKRQRFDSAFESQFDSVAFREDTSFYDEYIISDISFYDSSLRSASDSIITTSINTPTVIVGDITSLKGIKRRASLIEEESYGGHSHDGVTSSVIFRDGETTYQNHNEMSDKICKSYNLPKETPIKLIETCIDEVTNCDTL